MSSIVPGSILKKVKVVAAVVVALLTCSAGLAGRKRASEYGDDEGVKVGRYFTEEQNVVPHTGCEKQLPFAYYPSVNKLDVAIQLTPDLVAKAGGTAPNEVGVLVRDTKTRKVVARGSVALKSGYGRALIDVPGFPDGVYGVEYQIGKHKMVSPKTFKRIHFAFEKKSLGVEHRVYPPFKPVKVNGATIEVVDRKYRLNGFCLFDSIKSLGREILASPVRLEGRTASGQKIRWSRGEVSGKAKFEDEAVFKGSIRSPEIRIKSRAVIQEDGCAEVKIRLLPGESPTAIRSLKLIVPLKDKDMPLFHYIADNALRKNYAGKTPRGGKIKWCYAPWEKNWVPFRWKVEKPGSDDGVLITGADTLQWYNQHSWNHRPFIPYMWLGADKRGLAFFMENEKGFVTPKGYPGSMKKWKSLETPFYDTSINRLVRKGDTLAIVVDIIAGPHVLKKEREITFGFMATPGKPMETGFQTRSFASGCGSVVCWGGWKCSSKYPDNRDWSIVDKIQEIRKKGSIAPADKEFFAKKAQEVATRWPGRKVFGSKDWLGQHMGFAKLAQRDSREWVHSGTYFEEHHTDRNLPEWEVFQDEWAGIEFNRFQKKQGSGVFASTYHDFACYMANEWLKRGVSLYYDNTYPKRCYNIRFGPAYVGMHTEKSQSKPIARYGISFFAQRRYYRRIWKLVQHWNRSGTLSHPVDFTIHITNTYTVPFNTWGTSTLDFEAVAPQAGPSVPWEPGVPYRYKNTPAAGCQMPWDPDLLRTGTAGRQVGAIPLSLGLLSGHDRFSGQFPIKIRNRCWAIGRIHGIRQLHGPYTWRKVYGMAEDTLRSLGYGTDRAMEFNYWDEDPFVKVNHDDLKWMALVNKDQSAKDYGLLIVQSYSVKPIKAMITFPGAESFTELTLPWGNGTKADWVRLSKQPAGRVLQAKNATVRIDLPDYMPSRFYRVKLSKGKWPRILKEAIEERASGARTR